MGPNSTHKVRFGGPPTLLYGTICTVQGLSCVQYCMYAICSVLRTPYPCLRALNVSAVIATCPLPLPCAALPHFCSNSRQKVTSCCLLMQPYVVISKLFNQSIKKEYTVSYIATTLNNYTTTALLRTEKMINVLLRCPAGK